MDLMPAWVLELCGRYLVDMILPTSQVVSPGRYPQIIILTRAGQLGDCYLILNMVAILRRHDGRFRDDVQFKVRFTQPLDVAILVIDTEWAT